MGGLTHESSVQVALRVVWDRELWQMPGDRSLSIGEGRRRPVPVWLPPEATEAAEAAMTSAEKRAADVQKAVDIAADLQHENERLRGALNDIVNASRDEGLAKMCNWMRDRAFAALTGKDRDRR